MDKADLTSRLFRLATFPNTNIPSTVGKPSTVYTGSRILSTKLLSVDFLTTMTEFLHYKVDLSLRDGTHSVGVIDDIDKDHILLRHTDTGQTINVISNQIRDLKMLQLPPEMSKKKNNRAKDQPLDDAIVFSLPAVRTLASSAVSVASSTDNTRSSTPKIKAKKDKMDKINPAWGNGVSLGADFDFEANLAMFDKKSAFEDFQRSDTTSPRDRLVDHNKVKKEKYDNDEMVLDGSKEDKWDLIGAAPTATTSKQHSSMRPVVNRLDTASPRFLRNFKLVNSDNSSVVPQCTPVQLMEIERLATETFGVNAGIMAEIAASHLSRLITKNILGGSTRLSNKKNHNLPPLVLVLVGSGRCGARAFATGRHLTNHGIRVLAFVLNTEDVDKELQTQWSLFENAGGKVLTSDVTSLISTIENDLETPVELVIDALQGYADHLEDIFYQEEAQRSLRVLIGWCNTPHISKRILSLDIPSGIDGGSGTVLDELLQIKCHWCVSMGLPISGLLYAYRNGVLAYDDEAQVVHYLIDVGVPNKVYQSKGNLRKFDKFWYNAEFSSRLEVVAD